MFPLFSQHDLMASMFHTFFRNQTELYEVHSYAYIYTYVNIEYKNGAFYCLVRCVQHFFFTQTFIVYKVVNQLYFMSCQRLLRRVPFTSHAECLVYLNKMQHLRFIKQILSDPKKCR